MNEHLKKRFIIFNYISFALFVLFIEKPNNELRFCVNYKKLNVIIKRNRYFISLIDEVLIKILVQIFYTIEYHNCFQQVTNAFK